MSSVIGFSQNYRLRRTLSNAYTASLTLVNRYLNCAAGIQVGNVICHTASQTPSRFINSSFPVIDKLYWLEVFGSCFRGKNWWLKSANLPYHVYRFRQQLACQPFSLLLANLWIPVLEVVVNTGGCQPASG